MGSGSRFWVFAAAIALATCCTSGAIAAPKTPYLLDFNGGGVASSPSGDTIGGWEFTNHGTTWYALCLWDEASDGYHHPHEVGLWTGDGSTLLRTVTVNNWSSVLASESPDGRWLCTKIAPITTDGTYVLGATFQDGDLDAARVLVPPGNVEINGVFVQARQKAFTSTLQFPDQPVPALNDGVFGPNMATPEASGLLLLLLGLLPLGVVLLRRPRSAVNAKNPSSVAR